MRGREFLLELGRRGAGVSGDPRETVFLFQRLSVCIQRFNAVAYRGTFSPHHPDGSPYNLTTQLLFNYLHFYSFLVNVVFVIIIISNNKNNNK